MVKEGVHHLIVKNSNFTLFLKKLRVYPYIYKYGNT
jgi:hypothetical protein